MTISREDKVVITTNFDEDGYKIPFDVSDDNGNTIIKVESNKDLTIVAQELKCSVEMAKFIWELIICINWNIEVLHKDTQELAEKLLNKEK